MNFSNVDLDINSIKASMLENINEKGFNYSGGSNIDILTSLLAHAVLLNNQDTTLKANNKYMASAVDSNAISKLSMDMAYNIRRELPSRYRLNLQYNGSHTEPFDIDYIEIESRSGIKFVNTGRSRVTLKNGVLSSTITTYNKVLSVTNTWGNGSPMMNIPIVDDNITNDSIIVKSSVGDNHYRWELAKEYEDTPDGNSRIFSVNNQDGDVSLIFGDGVIGRIPQPDEYFTIQYFTCDPEADGETDFKIITIRTTNTALNTISDYSFTGGYSYGYSEIESNESVRINAPKHYARFGNNVVLSDFYNLLNIEGANVSASSLSKLNIFDSVAGSYYLYLVPISILGNTTSDVMSLPKDNIRDLVVTDDVKEYYDNKLKDDITTTITNPTYLYVDIFPKISVREYDNFEYISSQTFLGLSDYFKSINGFNMEFNNINSQQHIPDGVVDIDYDINHYVVFDNDSIVNHRFMSLDSGVFGDINCDISNDTYNRKIILSNESTIKKRDDIAIATYMDGNFLPNESGTSHITIGDVLLRVVISEISLGWVKRQKITLEYNKRSYPFLDITHDGVTLSNNIQATTALFDSLGIEYDINDMFAYTIEKTKRKLNNRYSDISTLNIDIMFNDTTIAQTKDVIYESNRKIADVNIGSGTFTVTPESWVTITTDGNNITFTDDGHDFLTTTITGMDINLNTINITNPSYKKGVIDIDGSDGNFMLYCHEYNSKTSIGTINVDSTIIEYNESIVIHPDMNSNISTTKSFSDFISDILEDGEKYYMRVQSAMTSGKNMYLLNNVNYPIKK